VAEPSEYPTHIRSALVALVISGLTAAVAWGLSASPLVAGILAVWIGILGLIVLEIVAKRRRDAYSIGRRHEPRVPSSTMDDFIRSEAAKAKAAAVIATQFSFVSKTPNVNIKLAAGAVQPGMNFKNVGTGVIRWEHEYFRVGIEGATIPTTIYLSRHGVLEPGESLLYEGAAVKGIDLTQKIEGHVEYAFVYGPPHQPRAFRNEEFWRFEFEPDRDGEFKTHTYKVRGTDKPC
jgi:hypothetical protein